MMSFRWKKQVMLFAPSALVVILLILSFLVWSEILKAEQPRNLRIAFLDVGQGDAIFIESPTGTQILVDGGPDSSLLRELTNVMNPFDRTLDAIIVTNPDQDHFAGFIELLERYKVGKEFESGTKKTTLTYKAFESALVENGVQRLLAKRGMVFDLGGGAYLSVLYPDRDVSDLSPNDGSIVMKLIYGKTSVLLMGDSTALVESRILSLGGSKKADILKLGHHGSKTSSSENWVASVSPSQAIVSASCDNSYGHPSKVVVDRLLAHAVSYLWTCKEGTISFSSDGEVWQRY